MDLYEGRLKEAIKFYGNRLARQEDVGTTLLTGPEAAWQFSVLIFIAMQAVKATDKDVRTFLEEWRRRSSLS